MVKIKRLKESLKLFWIKLKSFLHFMFLPKNKKKYWKNRFKNTKTSEPKNRIAQSVITRKKVLTKIKAEL